MSQPPPPPPPPAGPGYPGPPDEPFELPEDELTAVRPPSSYEETSLAGAAPAEPGPPLGEPPPSRDLWPWLLALLLVVLGGIVALLLLTRDGNDGAAPPTITRTTTVAPAKRAVVPKLVGLTQAQALTRLSAVGLSPRVRTARSDRREGLVVAQAPAPGRRLQRGARVVLTVSGGPGRIDVPNVSGLSASAATSRLRAAGFSVVVRRVFAARPVGVVVAQLPPAEQTAEKGSRVVVSVSKGRRAVAVPDVVGQARAAALETLRRAGLGARTFEIASSRPAGTVVAQNPAGGARARQGSSVRLNVARAAPATTAATTATTSPAPTTTPTVAGTTATTATTPTIAPSPTRTSAPSTSTGAATTRAATTPTTAVPDVVGARQGQAQSRIRGAGLVASVVFVPSAEPKGTVVAQHPLAGASARRGARVQINVSNGSQQRATRLVPDVTGQDQATATATLEQAGFTVVVLTEPTDDPSEDGIVLDERPAAGTRAPAGSEITLTVGELA